MLSTTFKNDLEEYHPERIDNKVESLVNKLLNYTPHVDLHQHPKLFQVDLVLHSALLGVHFNKNSVKSLAQVIDKHKSRSLAPSTNLKSFLK